MAVTCEKINYFSILSHASILSAIVYCIIVLYPKTFYKFHLFGKLCLPLLLRSATTTCICSSAPQPVWEVR